MPLKLFSVIKDDRPDRVCVLCENTIGKNTWYVVVHDFNGGTVCMCSECARAESTRLLKLTED